MSKGIKALIIAFCITFGAATLAYAAADNARDRWNTCLGNGGMIKQIDGPKGRSWTCVQTP
jgi:hypothetical protein